MAAACSGDSGTASLRVLFLELRCLDAGGGGAALGGLARPDLVAVFVARGFLVVSCAADGCDVSLLLESMDALDRVVIRFGTSAALLLIVDDVVTVVEASSELVSSFKGAVAVVRPDLRVNIRFGVATGSCPCEFAWLGWGCVPSEAFSCDMRNWNQGSRKRKEEGREEEWFWGEDAGVKSGWNQTAFPPRCLSPPPK